MRRLILITLLAAVLVLPACGRAGRPGPGALRPAAVLYTGTPDPTPVVVTPTPTPGSAPTSAGTTSPTITPPVNVAPAPEETRVEGEMHEAAPETAKAPAEAPQAGATSTNTQASAPEDTDHQAAGGEAMSREELINLGQQVYSTNCATCHQPGGQGTANYPALKGNEFVTSDPAPAIQTVLNGRNAMPSFRGVLSDQEIAAVLSYVRNHWNNYAPVVRVDQVQAVQESAAAQ